MVYLMLISSVVLLTGCREATRLAAGGYTETGENGISVYDFNSADGALKLLSKSDAGPNPSYFCISEKNKVIYSVNEVSDFKGTKWGGLTSLKYERNFENLRKVHEMPVPDGGPCFISLTRDNDFLLVANYGGGSVAVVKLDKKGIPEKVSDTISYYGIEKKVARAHMIASDPAGRRIYVSDLGLDRIMIYTLDKTSGKLIPFKSEGISLSPGTGPRHFVFNKSGSKMYVIGELSSTVSVYNVDKEEGLILSQTISTRKEGNSEINYCADIHIGKTGLFLYGSNRGENSIVTYRIENDGMLSLAGHTDCQGSWPRNFIIDPSGKYILVANQKSGNISVLRINKETGIPAEIKQQISHPAPSCLKF